MCLKAKQGIIIPNVYHYSLLNTRNVTYAHTHEIIEQKEVLQLVFGGSHLALTASPHVFVCGVWVCVCVCRYRWQHGITQMKHFTLPHTGETVYRDASYRRLSLTFRRILVQGTKKVVARPDRASSAYS